MPRYKSYGVRRKSDLPVTASGQRGGVLRAGPFRSQSVHDVVERYPTVVHRRVVHVHQQPGRPIRQLGTVGLQHGLHHQLHDILLRRSLRPQNAWHARVRPELVLLRRLLVRDHAVRHHGRLEIVRTHHRDRTIVVHRGTV